jgi:DNA polymerase III delta subunit
VPVPVEYRRRVTDAPALKPVYLITGSDRPKVETALARLRRHFPQEAVERVSAQEVTGADVVALCNAGSLFGDDRLVIVEGIDGSPGGDRRLTNAWKVAEVNVVVAYLADPAPHTVLALVGEETKKDAPLRKAVEKAGQVLEYSVVKRARTQWVGERFKAQGVRAEPEACALLIQLVGEDDLHGLASEIDKIALWAQGEPVGEREILELAAPSAEAPIFELTDAWGERDTARTVAVSEQIFDRDEKQRRDSAPRLAGALGSYLGRLRQLKRLAAEGVSAREAAGRLKMNPYYAQKVAGHADNFSDEELHDATVRLAELDLALKGGSRLAPDLELQRALIDTSRGRSPH